MIEYTEITRAPWITFGTAAAGVFIGLLVLAAVYIHERKADIY